MFCAAFEGLLRGNKTKLCFDKLFSRYTKATFGKLIDKMLSYKEKDYNVLHFLICSKKISTWLFTSV